MSFSYLFLLLGVAPFVSFILGFLVFSLFVFGITTANCIKLGLPGLDEGDVRLTKMQYLNAAAATSTSAIQWRIHEGEAPPLA